MKLQDKLRTSQLPREAAFQCLKLTFLCMGQQPLSIAQCWGDTGRAVSAAQDYVPTFLQSLKKFFLKISFVVYSWSSIFAKNVATSSALVLSFMTLPTKKGFLFKQNGQPELKPERGHSNYLKGHCIYHREVLLKNLTWYSKLDGQRKQSSTVA